MIKGIILVSVLFFSSMSYAEEDQIKKHNKFNEQIEFCLAISDTANIITTDYYNGNNLDKFKELIEKNYSDIPSLKNANLSLIKTVETFPKNIDLETQKLLIKWFKSFILKNCIDGIEVVEWGVK